MHEVEQSDVYSTWGYCGPVAEFPHRADDERRMTASGYTVGRAVWRTTADRRARKKYKTDLIPPALIVARWFAVEQAAIEKLQGAQETAADSRPSGANRTTMRNGPSPCARRVVPARPPGDTALDGAGGGTVSGDAQLAVRPVHR